ncbi:MAG TPA: GtrA family protein [Arenimonas sp.]|uniref:GtrA family protein n=1 Tax=Arenimonas sp. TaxID=1872635 RepID=UPI002D7EA6C4|nr:GtrA family protein [Arenimonas sp.]HEU0153631.1 GtrA family protein [Arenimonas sp.]
MTGLPHPMSRQVLLFLAVGGAQLLLDSAVFIGLTALGLPLVLGNVLGRVAGASLGYWLNGRYTFARGGEPQLQRRHLWRFLVAWSALTALSTALLAAVEASAGLSVSWLAKPLVEALMAAIGFMVWRHWVYR